MKSTNRLIALILSLALSFQFTAPVFAMGAVNTAESNLSSSEISSNEPPSVVREEVTLREENAKTFLLSDGSYLVAMYPSAVHQENATGEWVQIDNTLKATTTNAADASTAYSTTGEHHSLDVRFRSSLQDGNIFSLSNQGHTISVNLVDIDEISQPVVVLPTETPEAEVTPITPEDPLSLEQSASAALVPSPEETVGSTLVDLHPELKANVAAPESAVIEITTESTLPASGTGGSDLSNLVQNPEALVVDNLYQKVLYEDVFENVDLEYIAYDKTVKENIIVKKPLDSYQFAFELDIPNLSYTHNSDNSISLKNADGSTLFTIQRPIMFDANGLASNLVSHEIIEHNGTYYLTITGDKEWIDAAEFPVSIDPTLTTEVNLNQAITSSYVTEVNHYNNVFLIAAGRLPGEHGRQRGYIKFNLPALPAGSIVSRAYMQLDIVEIYDYDGADPRLYATAYLCPSAWNASTITWATQPGTPNRNPKEYMTMVESHDIYAGDKGCYISFDITKAVSYWMQNPSSNHGLVFADGFEENKKNHYTTLSTTLYNNYPVLTVTYRVAKGVESYWETYSASIEDAGTAHVNLFTGDLTVDLPLYTDTAQNMPFSYGLVYNSVDKAVQTSGHLHGIGWRSNLSQSVTTSSEGNARYRYIDADGTPHYIIADSSGKLIDEDGLGLTLTSTSSVYTLEDRDRTKYNFSTTSPGYLTGVTDSNGNQISISNSGTSTTITASGNRTFSLTRNASNYLTRFTDCLGQATSIAYSGTKLSTVTDPHGKKTSIAYSSANDITQITGPNGYSLKFTWDSQGRVASITERTTADGQKVTFDYSSYCTTRVRTSGPDDVHGNADDLITHYLFDEWGRTVSIYTTNVGQTKIYGVQNSEFTAAESGKNSNKLTKVAAHGSTALNMLSNSSLEDGISGITKTNWSGTSTSTLTAVSGTTMSTAYQGYKSAKLAATANTGVVAAQGSISLPAGSYTLSGYLKTENVQTSATDGGAALGVKVGSNFHYSQTMTGTSGNTFSIDTQSTAAANNAAYVANNKSINEEIEAGWRRVSVSFTLTAQTTVYWGAVLKNATGSVWFDALQLESGTVANAYNLLENSGFEASANGTAVPSGWTAGSGMNSANKVWNKMYSTADSNYAPMSGANAYRMVGRVTYGTIHNTGLVQLIPIRGEAGDVYTISGWVNLWSVPENAYHYQPIHQITCRIKYSNGQSLTIANAEANPYFIGWQYVSESFVLKNTQPSGVTITGLEVVLQFDNMPFYAAFDDIHLVKDEGVTYTYDTEGKLISSAALKEQTANIQYNETTDLPVSYTDVDGNVTSYTYDTTTRNLLTTTLPSGIKTTLSYSAGYKGNPNAQTISGGGLNIYTSQTMLDGGNFAYSSTNALGKTSYIYYNIYDPDYTGSADHILPNPLAAYPYVSGTSSGADGYTDPTPANNRLTGQPYAIRDEAGNLKLYQYTTDDYLAGVTQGGLAVDYTYSAGRLNSIRNGDALYGFTYNAYGALTGVTAGNQTLVSNTYAAGNGKLLSSTYSGTTVTYTYDALEQLAKKQYTNGDTVAYKYDGNGDLVQRSQSGGLTWDYVYDNAGTLVGAANSKGFLAKYKYDAGGRITVQAYAQDGDARTIGYAYNKDGQIEKIQVSGGTTQTALNTYDGLGRLTKKQWTQGSGQLFTGYTYKAGAGGTNATSAQLDTVVYGTGTSTVTGGWRYQYDDLGNITAVEQRGTGDTWTGVLWYAYDDNSQLVRVDDALNDETVLYTYDDQGNITDRTVYAYTRAATVTGMPIRTDSWTYGGADGNVLTASSINGTATSYSYAAYGIPSNWTGNRTLTWRNGTDLASIGGVTFGYDGEGQRVFKTSGSVTTHYTYEGSKLIRQEKNGERLFFLYDATGLVGFDHITSSGTTTYYYRYDGKGEIAALTDAAGNVLANYHYDAWGRDLGVTDASGTAITSSTHIGVINPFRYKSYYYDAETKLYYLNSRYYDPEVCRFISADDVELLGATSNLLSCNLSTYCYNNPVVKKDVGGKTPETVFDVVSFVTSAIEYSADPTNLWALAALSGDFVDILLPFVAGVGESVKVLRVSNKLSDTISYTDKVLKQMENTKDLNHAFPSLIDSLATLEDAVPIKGGDGIVRKIIRLPGSINKRSGVFEYIIEKGNRCNHRFFKEIK